MKIKEKLKKINESAGNISMYVGFIFIVYNMLKNNDFSDEPFVAYVIIGSLALFSLFRFISYKMLISQIRNNKESFINIQIDKRK